MPRHALSSKKITQIKQEHHTNCMAIAIEKYHTEQEKEKGLGLRKICEEAQKEYFKQKGIAVKLNHTTLWDLANGRTIARATFNREKSWLSQEETNEVIAYIIETSGMGFGLDYRRLKEHVDEIRRARYGPIFPNGGVGHCWTGCFVSRNSDRLHLYTARPLHDIRGKAANPEMKELWYDIVDDIQVHGDDGMPIAPECTWAMDEVGFQANGDEGMTKIIGAKGKKVQYQQQSGTRENITVLATVGGDGSALPPAVLYAGKGYMVKWKQENPANAS